MDGENVDQHQAVTATINSMVTLIIEDNQYPNEDAFLVRIAADQQPDTYFVLLPVEESSAASHVEKFLDLYSKSITTTGKSDQNVGLLSDMFELLLLPQLMTQRKEAVNFARTPMANILIAAARKASESVGEFTTHDPAVYALYHVGERHSLVTFPKNIPSTITEERIHRVNEALAKLENTPKHAVYVEDPATRKYLLIVSEKTLDDLDPGVRESLSHDGAQQAAVSIAQNLWDEWLDTGVGTPTEGQWAYSVYVSDQAIFLTPTTNDSGIPLFIYIKKTVTNPCVFSNALVEKV